MIGQVESKPSGTNARARRPDPTLSGTADHRVDGGHRVRSGYGRRNGCLDLALTANPCGRPTAPPRAVLLVCALVVPLLAHVPCRADVVPAEHERIVEVTVYPDRAEVVREAKLTLPAGASTVEFSSIPDAVEPDSFRVTGQGVRSVLGAVELQERVEEPQESPDLAAATQEVDRIQAEIEALDGADAVSKELRDYLTSVRTMASSKGAEKQAEGRPDPAAINAVYSLLQTRLQEQTGESLARRRKRENLQKQMLVAQARFASARPAGSIRTRIAAVEVDVDSAGSLTVRLAYVVPGASWHPSYRASLDPATGEVSLVSEAVVWQTTGEDWGGVSLRLSTAAPARSVAPPILSSWLLRPQVALAGTSPQAGAVTSKLIVRGGKVVDLDQDQIVFSDLFVEDLAVFGHSYENVLTLAPGVNDANGDGGGNTHGSRQRDFRLGVDGVSSIDPLTGTMMSNIRADAIDQLSAAAAAAAAASSATAGTAPPPPSMGSKSLESSVVHSTYDVTFEVPGRSDVPADGRDHRVVLRQETLAGVMEHRTIPGLREATFVVVKTQAPSAYPLLAGPMRVFTAGAYLGAYSILETAPGAELSIPFGIDKRIKVERTALPRTGVREGATGRDRRIGYTFKTTLENLRDQDVELIVQDRLPVSEDERIEVQPGKGMTPGFREVKDHPGIVEWTLALAPREKREVVLAYSVRIPKEIMIASAGSN